MSGGFRVHHEEPDFTIATFENALIWSFRGEATAARIRWATAVHRDLAKRWPKGFAVVTVIGERVPLSMPADARELSTAITREYQSNYCALCEVVEGTGFRAATVRSITAGIRIFARAKCPSRVFADVAACAKWLAPILPASEVALADAAERVRKGAS